MGERYASCPGCFGPGKELWHPLNMRPGELQSQCGRVWRRENLLPQPGSSTEVNMRAITTRIRDLNADKAEVHHSVQNLLSSRLLSKNVKIKIHRTIILPVVLYGCGTWSLTLREERRLRVFENKVLRRIFGSRRDEVTGDWRRLHNEELNDLYS